jgi:hypothetical protein
LWDPGTAGKDVVIVVAAAAVVVDVAVVAAAVLVAVVADAVLVVVVVVVVVRANFLFSTIALHVFRKNGFHPGGIRTQCSRATL